MDFTLTVYRRLLETLKSAGYTFCRLEDYLSEAPEGKFVILRHDVDRKPGFSLAAAKLEDGLGIRASYYFRIVKCSFHVPVIREIAAMGHEIGYHYEDLAAARGDMETAIRTFETNLEQLREFYPVRTVCMHGRPTSGWDSRDLWKRYDYRDFNLIGEPYFDIDFTGVFYLTDTGRSWDNRKMNVRDRVTMGPVHGGTYFKSTEEIIAAVASGDFPHRVMLNTHPERWTDSLAPWLKQYLWQNSKNIIKRIIVNRNS